MGSWENKVHVHAKDNLANVSVPLVKRRQHRALSSLPFHKGVSDQGTTVIPYRWLLSLPRKSGRDDMFHRKNKDRQMKSYN